MARYVLKRFVASVAVVVAATVVVFLALSLVPGDPAVLILGFDATPEAIDRVRQQLGLDQPLWKQYIDFMAGLAHGDLGVSYQYGTPVGPRLVEAFEVTALLSAVALFLAVVAGVGLGMLAATRANTWVDNVLRVILLSSTSIPTFWLGLLLIYAFAVRWPIFPSFGWGTGDHIVLPAITLATFPLAIIGRMTRASVIDVLGEDYIRTARAKGLPVRHVLLRHALPNALIPVVTVIGLQFGILLAGAVLTETVFSVPGMGQLLINAILARDLAIIRGTVLVGVVVVIGLNFLVDMLYLVLDPRLRYG